MNRLNKEAHAIEEINGVRCAIAEKDASPERAEFLKKVLEHNGYKVQSAPMPPPKAAVPKPDAETPVQTSSPAAPEKLIIGVTDVLFHPMLAIYERRLKTPEGDVMTTEYWNQEPGKEGWYWKR